MVKIKRVYDQPAKADGYRILVDRLWPRGMSKERAACEWLREVAPSNELRKWYGHKPERFDEFKKRYASELKDKPAFEELKDMVQSHVVVTLVYATRDEEHNQARILQEFLNQ